MVSRAKHRLSGQQEAQQTTNRVDIDAAVKLFAQDGFRSHVVGCAHDNLFRAQARRTSAVLVAHESEIKNLDEVILDTHPADVNVRWLDVTMNESHAVR